MLHWGFYKRCLHWKRNWPHPASTGLRKPLVMREAQFPFPLESRRAFLESAISVYDGVGSFPEWNPSGFQGMPVCLCLLSLGWHLSCMAPSCQKLDNHFPSPNIMYTKLCIIKLYFKTGLISRWKCVAFNYRIKKNTVGKLLQWLLAILWHGRLD